VSAVTNSNNGLAIVANKFLIVLTKRLIHSGLPDRPDYGGSSMTINDLLRLASFTDPKY
jgi:hypothetical protein